MKYLFLVLLFSLSACLTHKDIREEFGDSDRDTEKNWSDQKKKISTKGNKTFPTGKAKKNTSDIRIGKVSVLEKLSQIETSIRELRGQMESMNKVQKDRVYQLEQGLLALIQTLDLRVATLADKVNQKKKKGSSTDKASEIFFEQAEKFFKKKNWKSAIITYEKYREKNKKGAFYRQSTFQIGRCFQKLQMYKEAKVFFREVAESFPGSVEAKEAKKISEKASTN